MHAVLEDKRGVPQQFWGSLTDQETQRKQECPAPQRSQAMTLLPGDEAWAGQCDPTGRAGHLDSSWGWSSQWGPMAPC